MGETHNFFSENGGNMKFNAAIPLVCFVLGIASTWLFLSAYDTKLFQIFAHAYSVGKADGYVVAKAKYQMNRDKLEYTCAFLWSDESDLQKHR
tara:strand:+ start:344 stop:622 length:279 start_codon:yes stop_codon:yes gene_type:complete